MIRKWVAKLNRTIAGSVVSPRKSVEAPIKIWFEPNRNTGALRMPTEGLAILGETHDLSKTGISFIVPSIRIRENYLVGESRVLNAELDLPDGKVRMKIVGRRYEQVGEHISTARFLVGAEIHSMADDSREVYEHFLKFGNRRRRRGLELGIDKG